MRVATIADCHVGNHSAFAGQEVGRVNRRCQMILDTLAQACEVVIEQRCQMLVVAGDLFENDHPFPDHILAVIEIFSTLKKAGVEVHLVVGNHDQHSAVKNDNALAPLKAEFFVHEHPSIINPGRLPTVGVIPFGYNPLDLDLGSDVVITHHGISDTTTHPGKAAGSWVIRVEAIRAWMQRTGTSLYLAGDWHEHKAWEGHRIYQIGALAPVNWTNKQYKPCFHDPYGSVMVFDHQAVSRIIVPGPRFMTVASEDEARVNIELAKQDGNQLFVELLADTVATDLRETVRASGNVKKKQTAVVNSAKELSTDSSIEEQVREYLQQDTKTPDDIKPRLLDVLLGALKEARCQQR